MPLVNNNDVSSVEMLPGVFRKTLGDGENLTLIEVRLEQGAVVPMHTHPHEQSGYLVEGSMRFVLGDEERVVEPGDVWMIPGNIPHQVTALTPCVLVDVFSPRREEYR